MQVLGTGVQALAQRAKSSQERQAAARRTWCDGAQPVAAKTPRWAKDSLGDRFFASDFLARARQARSLAHAKIPDTAFIMADPVHWTVAAEALIRAVVFDDLGLDRPAVGAL